VLLSQHIFISETKWLKLFSFTTFDIFKFNASNIVIGAIFFLFSGNQSLNPAFYFSSYNATFN
jgi:hypothetical protein